VTRAGAFATAILGVLTGCSGDTGVDRVPDAPTFNEHVAPILYENCSVCHRPDGPGPFTLLGYEDARVRADLIVTMTGERRMPPWLPDSSDWEFAHERRLTDVEIETIRRWAERGAPRGEGAGPAPPERTEEWMLGTPDLVIEMDEAYEVPAAGGDVFRNFVLDVPLDRTRYVRAVEMQPGTAGVVHHAIMAVDPTATSREEAARDSVPGFDGMFARSAARPPGGFFIGWTPGLIPRPNPMGLAWPLAPGSDFVIQMHFRPTGTSARVKARVGFHFADSVPARMPTLLRLGAQTLDIPAGEPHYEVTDSFTVPVDVDVLGVYPHAHYLGKVIDVRAAFPDGTEKQLILIEDWDFNWQDTYAYDEPAHLPSGTTLKMRYVYDNSAANPRNPNSPPERVVYGPHSADEMAELWVQALPSDPAMLGTLEREMARKSVRDRVEGWRHLIVLDPADASAHSNLAGWLAGRGQTDSAIAHYRRAIEAEPDFEGARYNLAVLLESRGDPDEAVALYRSAIRLRPDHAPSHNNLGRLLAAEGRREEAIPHFRRVTELDPDSAGGWFNLAIALAAERRPDDALEALRTGERLAPAAAQERLAVAWILATHPDASGRDPAAAITISQSIADAMERAHPLVLDVLAAAHAASGTFGLAVRIAEDAAGRADAAGLADLAAGIRRRLDFYRDGRAYTEPIR
jgi:tetratricopeptide (TPR) repeat protein